MFSCNPAQYTDIRKLLVCHFWQREGIIVYHFRFHHRPVQPQQCCFLLGGTYNIRSPIEGDICAVC